MVKQRMFFAVLLFFALILAGSSALAIEEGTIDLKGRLWENVKGTASISDAGENQKQIAINASGLQPNSTYTVWFINEKAGKDMSGVGAGDYSFKTDSQGNGRYTALVSEDQFTGWDAIEVAFHPDGNAKNMENIKTALKGDLEKITSDESRAGSPESGKSGTKERGSERGGTSGGASGY